MRPISVLLGAAFALAAGISASAAGPREDCAQREDPALAVGACSAIIDDAAAPARDRSLALNNRGLMRHRLGQLDAARADFDRAIALDPGRPIPFNNRGNTRASLGDHAGAVSDYDRALALDPDYGNAHNGRANALCALGRIAESHDSRLHALDLGALNIAGVQRALTRLGFLRGEPSGVVDPATDAALQDWTRAGCPRR